MPMKIISFLLISLVGASSWAVSSTMTLSGHLNKPDGTPLVSNNVGFQFSITNPSGTCVVYTETISTVDLSGSNGNFELRLGTGTVNFPVSAVVLKDVFKNFGTLACSPSGSYNPGADDARGLSIQFIDQNESTPTWRAFTSLVPLTSVPFAMVAESAAKLGTNVATDFLTKVGLPTCTVGNYLTWDGTAMTCTIPAGGSGTVTSVSLSMPAIFSVGGSPLTSSGTLSATLNNQAANTFFAAPSATLGSPSFRALTTSDFPNTAVTAGNYGLANSVASFIVDSTGRITSATNVPISITTANVTGTMPIANGGTGATTATAARANLGAATSGANTDITSLTSGINLTLGAAGSILMNSMVGIGTGTPRTQLDVQNGAITGATVSIVALSADFLLSNIQYSTNSCGAFTLNNLKEGGNYIFVVKGTTATTCSFTAFSDMGVTPLTVHLPPDHGATVSGKQTVYNMFVAGGELYLSWNPGY
jgi:hypothetical protein